MTATAPNPLKWEIISPYMDQALDLSPTARAGWLAELTISEPAIADAVREMLASHALVQERGFLANSLIDRAHQVDRTGTRIGGYTIDRLLGRGGMGEVWLATRTDGRFDGKCAIKFLDERVASAKLIERFAREAQLLARLKHQNVARLLDAGATETGAPYLALEFVDGVRIDRYCDTHTLSVEARVRLFVAVVAAVAHAHSHLIVHRDLKPSNVLVSADGEVKLLDFGIAKLISSDTTDGLTRVEDIALTPDFAAPEQLLGEMPTTATDVYQLGLLLYVLLTHSLPKQMSGSRAERTRVSIDEDLPAASTTVGSGQAKHLRGDLDAILAKALRRDPLERYATAQAFQDELLRYLNREPVEARRGATWYRVRRFATRHAISLGAAAAVVAALLIGATLAMREAGVARSEAIKAQAVQTFITDIFLTSRSDQPDPLKAQKTTARELLLTGAQRVKTSLADAPAAKAEVLQTLSLLMLDLDLADEAVALQKDRIALLRQQRDRKKLPAALLILSDAMGTADTIDERDTVLAEAQSLIESQKPADPALRAELNFQWAIVEQYRDWTKSATHARQASDWFREHGPEARAAESLQLEADAAFEQNDLDTAERALTAGAAIARELKQDRSRVLPGIESALAEVQAFGFKVDAADASYRRAVAEAKRVYGPDHTGYLDSLKMYGSFLTQYSRGAEALPLLREAAETNRRINGDNEAYFGPNYESMLAVTLVDHGMPDEGAPLFAHAMQVKRDAGRNNLALAAFLHLAARAPQDLGDAKQGFAYLDEARGIIASHDAQSGQDLMRSNEVERARLALRLNKPADALAHLKQAGVDPTVAPGDRRELMFQLLFGEALAHNGEMEGAARAAASSRAFIERLGLEKAFARESARLDLIDGMVKLAASDTTAATSFLRRSLQTRQAVLDARSPLIAESQLWLARAIGRSNSKEAEDLIRSAKRIVAAHSHVAPQFAAPLMTFTSASPRQVP